MTGALTGWTVFGGAMQAQVGLAALGGSSL